MSPEADIAADDLDLENTGEIRGKNQRSSSNGNHGCKCYVVSFI